MYKQIKSYLAQDIYPFHMPGHKRNPMFMPSCVLQLDMTEIPGMDILSSPSGMICDLQTEIAKFYGARHSFLLVNGSSSGIIAAICATCSDGDTLVVPRNAHVSAYRGMVLSGAVPFYILPEITNDGLAGGVSPTSLDNMPYGAAVLIVSPTYEGFVSNIKVIAEKVHARGGILIVDEAHGAHFAFDHANDFPRSALQNGADIVVQSMHKTLPMLSQCAVLHVNGENVDMERLRFFVNALQTTSPSYIFMSVCDYVLRYLWNEPQLFTMYAERLASVRTLLPGTNSNATLRLMGREMVGQAAIFNIDPGKLLLTAHTTTSAEDIAEMMLQRYKIQMEMAAAQHILAMTSVADTDEGFERFINAIDGLNRELAISPTRASSSFPYSIPQMAIPPRQAANMLTKQVPWQSAAGKICGQLVTQYPPGIALVAPGEIIPPNLPKLKENIQIIER